MIQSNRTMRAARVLVAALALGGLGIAAPAPQPADAAGIRSCPTVIGSPVGCYETVWANGAEYRMTFSNQSFAGATPTTLAPFYVLAPQGDVAQGFVSVFPHDHVVGYVPTANGGHYSTRLQGFFVLCTGQGLVSGACVPLWMSPGGPALPFADVVAGGALTSTDAIEAAAAAGNVALVDLGPGAVIVGTISGR